MKIKELKKKYKSTCNEYLEKFCNKQEMENEGWVADEVGGVALCSDFYFNFHDIVLDINTKQPKGLIIDWYDDNLQNPDKSINYYSYIKGLRIKDISNVAGQSEQFLIMKKLAVIIKHPFIDWDWRVAICKVPEDMEKHELKKYIESKMLGPLEVVGISDKIDFDRKVDFPNAT